MSLAPRIYRGDGQGREVADGAEAWLAWTPDPSAEGYGFITPTGQSRTFDARLSVTHLGKWSTISVHTAADPFAVQVDALDVTSRPYETATWPPIQPPPPPPPPTRIKLARYGVCPGHAARVWSDARHLELTKRCGVMRSGHGMLWRVEGFADAKTDRDVKNAAAAGMVAELVVGGTSHGDGATAGLVQLAGQMAGRYGDSVVYAGMNEPDLNGWTAAGVATAQVGITDAIKSVAPNAIVLWPGLWKGTPNAFTSWQPYVKALIAKGKAAGDAANGHYYDNPLLALNAGTYWNVWGWWVAGNPIYAGQTADVLLHNAGLDIPLVNDESGPAHVPDLQVQAQGFVTLLDQATKGRVHTSVLYCVGRDVPGYPFLFNDDNTPLPAVAKIAEYLAGVPVPA